MPRRLLMVHAHPDDESIATGGTLAHYVAAGVAVTLVTCTLGEEGEVISAGLRGLAADAADQLGGYRHVELSRACADLGVRDHRYLGGIGRHRDSGMAGTLSAAHPRALYRCLSASDQPSASTEPGERAAGSAFDKAVAELVSVLAEVRPQVVVSYDADGGYGHPDHLAAHRIARAAAIDGGVPRFFAVIRPESAVAEALTGFRPAPGYRAPVPADLGFAAADDRVDVRIPTARQWDRQRRALAAHATQVDVLPDGFALSNAIAQPLFDAEYFALLDGEPLPDGIADDLFAGLET